MSKSRSKPSGSSSCWGPFRPPPGDGTPRSGFHALKLLQGTKPKPKAKWAVRLLPLTEEPIQVGWRNVLAWGTGEPFTLHLKLWTNPSPPVKP